VNLHCVDRKEMCNKCKGRGKPQVRKGTRQLVMPGDLNDSSCSLFVGDAIFCCLVQITRRSVLNQLTLLLS
jgi:hypothetical protein